MYMMTEVQKIVRIPPSRLGEDIDDIVGAIASESFEGRLQEDRSISVLVDKAEAVGPGKIVHGDGAVYQTVKFKQLVFKPLDNEVVEGVVVEVLGFGAFVRIGPIDGLVHISQVMDDRGDADQENGKLIGKETGRVLSVGDHVRARIVSIELNEKNPEDSKIGLTMKQPGLGRLEWLDEDERKRNGESGGKKNGGSD